MTCAGTTDKTAILRVQIKPTGSTIADYQEAYERTVTNLLGSEQQPPPVPPDRLKVFEQAVTNEKLTLDNICLGLKQELIKHSMTTVEENPSIILEVKITHWGTDSSLPVSELNSLPRTVKVTCKKADRELFTTIFQQSSWGFSKTPYAIGVSLGKKTAKRLLENSVPQ